MADTNRKIQELLSDYAGALRDEFRIWLDGWDHGLREQFHRLTGHRPERIIDARFLTGDDARGDAGRAAGIGVDENPARPLALPGRRG